MKLVQGEVVMNSKSFVVTDFIKELYKKDRIERIAIFIWGVLIYAISFSIFFSPLNIVTGGSAGLALIINHLFGVDTSVTVFVFSFILLVIGYFLLGKYNTLKTVLGVILLPIFMEFSSVFQSYFNLDTSSLFIRVLFGGIVMGLGNGMVLRSGFSCGGFQTLYQILYKYFGISIGKSTLLLNGILIFISGFFFGFSNSLYAIIGLYASSLIADKVMLETSVLKTFYIVTNKEKEISQYIVEDLGHGATILNAKGGYTNDTKKVVMTAIPTIEYCRAKEFIQEIDKDVFFLILDTYEIYGNMYD